MSVTPGTRRTRRRPIAPLRNTAAPTPAELEDLARAVARYVARCQWNGDCLENPRVKAYGVVRHSGGRQIAAHRASYLIHNGPIPFDLLVRHACDNPPCVAPDHLLLGTSLDNERDKWERGRGAFGLDTPNATVPPEIIRDAVAEYLRGGVSQQAMARRLGVGQSTFGRWVRAEARPDIGLEGVTVGNGSRLAVGLMPHGTRAGYFRHRRDGEAICVPCLEANRDYFRDRRRRLRAQASTDSGVAA